MSTFTREAIKRATPFADIPWSGKFRRTSTDGKLYIKGTDTSGTELDESNSTPSMTDRVVEVSPTEDVTKVSDGVEWA